MTGLKVYIEGEGDGGFLGGSSPGNAA